MSFSNLHAKTDQSRALDIRYGPKTQTDGKSARLQINIDRMSTNYVSSQEEIRPLVGGYLHMWHTYVTMMVAFLTLC